MQLVIAAITTAPWPIVACPPRSFDRHASVARSFSASPKPRSFTGAVSALRNDAFICESATRSCGRFGPARLGSTVARSSSSVSVKTGSGELVACGTGPAPCSSARRGPPRPARGRCGAGSRASRRRPGRSRSVAPYSGAMLATVARSARLISSEPRPVELDELLDDALLAQHLRDGQHEVGRRRALGQLARRAGSRRPAASACRAAGRASPPRPRCRRRPSRARRGR